MPTASHRQRWAAREKRLQKFGYASYNDYLGSPAWQAVKANYRADPERTQECMCGETEVQMHHMSYERVGEEHLDDLVPLCSRCHTMIHVLERRGEIALNFDGFRSTERAAAYAEQMQPLLARRLNELSEGQAERLHRLRRSMASRLRAAITLAERSNVDMTAELYALDEAISALEALADSSRHAA